MAWKGVLALPKNKFSAEPIVMLLGHIEVSQAQRKFAPVTCLDAKISQ
jgi:hypothetical protein